MIIHCSNIAANEIEDKISCRYSANAERYIALYNVSITSMNICKVYSFAVRSKCMLFSGGGSVILASTIWMFCVKINHFAFNRRKNENIDKEEVLICFIFRAIAMDWRNRQWKRSQTRARTTSIWRIWTTFELCVCVCVDSSLTSAREYVHFSFFLSFRNEFISKISRLCISHIIIENRFRALLVSALEHWIHENH